MTRARRRTFLAFALFFASAGVVACSALVGVEDVRLAKTDAAPGDETLTTTDGPSDLDASSTAEASVQITSGYNFGCARKLDGHVLCWGDNGGGEIGDGISFDAGDRPSVLVPQDVVGINDAAFLASGLDHSCVVHAGGTVSCWGINLYGQLGDATTDRSSTPVLAIGITDAVTVACGTDFSCAVLKDQTVSCWGANYSGQLGDGTTIDRSTPASVQQLSGVTAIALGDEHACALLTNGSLKCWGKNAEGEFGNGTVTDSTLPLPLASLSGIAQVVAAAHSTCARNASGQVYCWGANDLGQLGTGSSNAAPNPSPAITNVKDAIAIWNGYEHACAVRRNGEVQCWGEAGEGEVGSGSVPDDASIPQPSTVVGVSGALDVTTGGEHSCATTANGAVYCWGQNSLGQLGDGLTANAYAAVPVTGFP